MPDLSQARRVMVDNQIRTFDVTDREVLAAFDVVPRERFVEPADVPLAYSDAKLAVKGANESRALLVPLVLARLVQALAPKAGESALDCCGGLGYSAAILADLGLKVTFAETDSGLTARAADALAGTPEPVKLLAASCLGAATAGAVNESYDVILINGAVEREPTALLARLKDGGRLGVIVKQGRAAQARIYLRSGDAISHRMAFDALAPVLPGFQDEPGFVF
ncbi:MAG: protein-L-isoaspartate O-methyltransferase [Beijerinckiaceae bacterium]|jgi:protein-L-isoaspartate(D-aspartate) O-methyltransferase|nr:protein-L-isoaspartate O-methyltransferase [Beijerinckiaceae bacterium]